MEARVEYYADINGTATVFNSTIHDTEPQNRVIWVLKDLNQVHTLKIFILLIYSFQ